MGQTIAVGYFLESIDVAALILAAAVVRHRTSTTALVASKIIDFNTFRFFEKTRGKTSFFFIKIIDLLTFFPSNNQYIIVFSSLNL